MLTRRKLKKIIKYDKETGVFIWKVSLSNRVKKGDIVGPQSDNNGYLSVRINKKAYYLHRLAFLYVKGYIPENKVDHIDCERDNNSWGNLREISDSCNSKNCKISKNNKSGITGVSFDKNANKWGAGITINRIRKHLGLFDTLEGAANARYKAEIDFNFLDCLTKSTAKKYLDSLL